MRRLTRGNISLYKWGMVTYSIPPANVAPASDVISLLSRYRYLRRSIRSVSTHVPNASATAAEILVSIAVGEGDLLDLPYKRCAGERRDVVVGKVQPTATQHQACQFTCAQPFGNGG
jgi:hypothetical protein